MLSKMYESYNLLMDGGVVKEGHWKLTSGKHANFYINKDDIIINPILYPLIVSRMSASIRQVFRVDNYEVVTGPAVAGINFSAPISINLGKISVYPEKTWPEYPEGFYSTDQDYEMTFRSSFKKVLKGKRVILIEDVITTAGSICKTIESVYKCGGDVIGVFCIWNRNPSKRKIFSWETIVNGKAKLQLSMDEVPESHEEIPIYGLVERSVDSWEKEECPLCKAGVPLQDPKTGKIIEG